MADINSNVIITKQTGVAPSSLGGNTAQYAENKWGGSNKVRKNSKKGKRTTTTTKAKKTVKRRSVKKCWWKFF
jgi:hypothetical protein